ncbi:MAG: hypothetical protein K6F15_04215 [Treponema sp.]|nr:hypothetical protein [Treponema sp.]
MNKTDYTLNLKPAVYEVLENVFRDNQIFSAEDLKFEVLKIYSGALRSHLASVSRPLWEYRKDPNKKCSFICVSRSKGLYKKIPLCDWDEEQFQIERKEREFNKAFRIISKNPSEFFEYYRSKGGKTV